MTSTAVLMRLSSLFTYPTTSRGWFRTVSDRRSSSAAMIQLATSEEPPAARNGVVRPGQRDHPGDAADHDEHLQRDHEGQADAEQPAEVIRSGEADAHAAGDEEQVQREDGEQAGEAELLAEAGDDEVAFGERDDGRAGPRPSPVPMQPAVREAEQALHELVAAALPVVDVRVERVEPAVEAGRDVAEGLAGDHGAGEEQSEPEDHPAEPAGGDVDHHQEQAEVEQRRCRGRAGR